MLQCQMQGLKARLLMCWPDSDTRVVRQLASALDTLVSCSLPKYSDLDLVAAGKATVGKKIQSDSELYLRPLHHFSQKSV